MTPEDREAMRRATIDVKTAIRDDFTATDEEIQETLWYYYFDVDKTVDYLRGILGRLLYNFFPLIKVSREKEAQADKTKVHAESEGRIKI